MAPSSARRSARRLVSLPPDRKRGPKKGVCPLFLLQEGPEASGPPPHSHPWDESFYVVKGKIEFGIGARHGLAVAL
jgi:hypothetical protein